ncbi:hypothetical protein IMZ11_28795 [Microtetraspora sp. AC03309]|uniref:hypothetical protein n=1 Tax=Microtetraspora sp. AC03309 TaxID=2779376 RepID=UPI001E63638B|nr:hypothetical protein [Microtetraspora sp. AC03309]MCC5579635.1 hypothetical protein [Microtetraspora sp. AC03309]
MRKILFALILALSVAAPAQAATATATAKQFGFLAPADDGRLAFAKGKIWRHPEFEAWEWKRTGKWTSYEVSSKATFYVNILANRSASKRVSYEWLHRHLKPSSARKMGFYVWFDSSKRIVKVSQVYTP